MDSRGHESINWHLLELSPSDLEQCLHIRVGGFGNGVTYPPLVDDRKCVHAKKENRVYYELSAASECSFLAFCNAAHLFSLSALNATSM